MTEKEIVSNAVVLIVVGSQTTATLLSGPTFHLLKSPPILKKLSQEIRGAFRNNEQMTFAAKANMPYLQECLNEV
jgi:cytochrome P450